MQALSKLGEQKSATEYVQWMRSFGDDVPKVLSDRELELKRIERLQCRAQRIPIHGYQKMSIKRLKDEIRRMGKASTEDKKYIEWMRSFWRCCAETVE